MKRVVTLVVIAVVLLAFVWLPLAIPADMDFEFLYHAAIGVRQGISPYDFAGLTRMIATMEGASAGRVNVPYAYPPWYALAALPLAFFPAPAAARIWFLVNLAMLMGAVWFLTDGWPPRRRLPAFLAAALFVPVAGGIIVGQYDFPVLLGAATLAYALAHQKPGLTALAFGLLTFKPHIGTLILLVGLVHVISRKNPFGRRALRFTLLAGLFLFVVGFLASRTWPLDYLRSLVAFKAIRQCTQCNSLALAASNLWHGSFGGAIAVAVILLILAIAILVWQRRILAERPQMLVAAATLATLLISPFLQNYDYMLLLVPLLTVAGQAHGWDWAWLAIAFLLPLPGFLLPISGGESTLIISTLILLGLFVRILRGPQAATSQPEVGVSGA
jgi:hypothetical protein